MLQSLSLKFLTYFCSSVIRETVLDINLGTCLRPSALLSSSSWHSLASSLQGTEIVPSGSCREQDCYSQTPRHPFLGCKCSGFMHFQCTARKKLFSFHSSLNFAKFSITLSLADKSQLGSSCSLTTVTGPISPKRAIQQQCCCFLGSCISSISFFFCS